MDAEHPPIPVRLALALAPGHTIDVPADLVPAILAAEPAVRRECLKWTRMHGAGGRVIVIDSDLVARIIKRWPVSGSGDPT
jgi:hypothetical protein